MGGWLIADFYLDAWGRGVDRRLLFERVGVIADFYLEERGLVSLFFLNGVGAITDFCWGIISLTSLLWSCMTNLNDEGVCMK